MKFNLPNFLRRYSTKIVNVSRMNSSNIGDRYSSPGRYIPFLRDCWRADIMDPALPRIISRKILVIGGGGLIANSYFAGKIERLLASKPLRTIGWGIGHNVHGSSTISMPAYLKQFDLAGLRDYGFGFEWVPCSSCLLPLFDQEYKPTRSAVIYEHAALGNIPIKGIPKLTNAEKSIKKVLAFLASGELILTSSYHGAYWGILLNRKVVVISPFSSKFYGFKYRIPIADAEHWRTAANEAISYPNALDECRKANLGFAEKVRAVFDFAMDGE